MPIAFSTGAYLFSREDARRILSGKGIKKGKKGKAWTTKAWTWVKAHTRKGKKVKAHRRRK